MLNAEFYELFLKLHGISRDLTGYLSKGSLDRIISFDSLFAELLELDDELGVVYVVGDDE